MLKEDAVKAERNPKRIPPGAWDSHLHVVDLARFPISGEAQYRPSSYTLDQALEFEVSSKLHHLVLVQPSFYGTDNDCMLNALRILGPNRSRAVVVIDPNTISSSQLSKWHNLGVRGVRINFISGEQVGIEELRHRIAQFAKLLAPLRWVLQLHAPLETIAEIEEDLANFPTRVCLDHFGRPSGVNFKHDSLFMQTRNPYDIRGFDSLIRLLADGNTFVKMSAAYRFVQPQELDAVAPIAKEILSIRQGTRVVFATDWPHTRMEHIDIGPFPMKVLEWCGTEDVANKVFRSNAEELWS